MEIFLLIVFIIIILMVIAFMFCAMTLSSMISKEEENAKDRWNNNRNQ